MNKQNGFIGDEIMMIDGQRVSIPKLIGEPGKGVEPSYGYHKRVMTPWGVDEDCIIVTVPSLSGEKDKYAQVYRPKSNPGVAFSTFRLTDI